MRIWVTRSQPGAEATAGRLRDFGHEPLVAPLLIVRQLDAGLTAEGVNALAFTSGHGVRAVAGALNLPVFAVGEATAKAARAAGYADVHAGSGDAAALGAMIAAALPPGSLVLHPCAAERAGDMEGPLTVAGLTLRAVPVYETVPAPVDAAILDALARAEAVLLHSPKAARVLDAVLSAHPAAIFHAFCLSPAVAGALTGGKIPTVAIAALPNDTALLKLLPH